MQLAEKVDEVSFFSEESDNESSLLGHAGDPMALDVASHPTGYPSSACEIENGSAGLMARERKAGRSEPANTKTLMRACGTSKLLSMINIESEEASSCKHEVESLTEEEATLFLKLVKLYKDPNSLKKLSTSDCVSDEGQTTQTSSMCSPQGSSERIGTLTSASCDSSGHDDQLEAGCEQSAPITVISNQESAGTPSSRQHANLSGPCAVNSPLGLAQTPAQSRVFGTTGQDSCGFSSALFISPPQLTDTSSRSPFAQRTAVGEIFTNSRSQAAH